MSESFINILFIIRKTEKLTFYFSLFDVIKVDKHFVFNHCMKRHKVSYELMNLHKLHYPQHHHNHFAISIRKISPPPKKLESDSMSIIVSMSSSSNKQDIPMGFEAFNGTSIGTRLNQI